MLTLELSQCSLFGRGFAQTLPCFRRSWLPSEACLLERAPFEILLVAATIDAPLLAMQTEGLGLVTFQPFCFASYTTWSRLAWKPQQAAEWNAHDKSGMRLMSIPLRLFDCFGFTVPSGSNLASGFGFGAVDWRFGAPFVVFARGLGDVRTGDSRKAEGEGMLIASMEA